MGIIHFIDMLDCSIGQMHRDRAQFSIGDRLYWARVLRMFSIRAALESAGFGQSYRCGSASGA